MSVSALSSLSPRAGKQIAGWEVGIGAALAVGGVVNYGFNEAVRFSLDKYGEDPRRDLSLLRPWTSVVASMAGFGVGLALGGVVKLIYHRRRHRGESIVVRPGIGGGLLAVEGGF